MVLIKREGGGGGGDRERNRDRHRERIKNALAFAAVNDHQLYKSLSTPDSTGATSDIPSKLEALCEHSMLDNQVIFTIWTVVA